MADRGFVSTKLAFEIARLGLVSAINGLEAAAQVLVTTMGEHVYVMYGCTLLAMDVLP